MTSQPQSSFCYESSTFLKSKNVPRPTPHVFFNFVISSPLNQIKLFFITVIRKKYSNVFYGYDSSSFCLLKCERNLKKGKRYMIYGKLSKNKLYFLECLKEEEIDYKELCYMLLG